MTFIPEYITRDGVSPDTLYSQAGKINDNLEAIETELGSLVAGISNFTFTCTALTGGAASALDGIDGDEASDGDTAVVFVGNNPGAVYFYRLDADNGGSENSPDIITPDVNAGTKVWVLMSRPARIWTGGAAPTVGDDSADGVLNGDVWLYSGDAWICASNAAGAAVWRKVLSLGTGSTNAAAGDHTHSGVYATTDHDHDSDYSAIGHTHDYSGDFADIDHDASHVTGGTDEIDGDKLDIDWNPTNYTPTTVESYADSADNLTAHLKGIDTAIGSLGGGSDLSQLENTLAMMAWDLYAVDNTFDDVLTDDFGEGTAADSVDDSSTIAEHDPITNKYVVNEQWHQPGTSCDGSWTALDIKGTIAYWQSVAQTYGFFSTNSDGSTPVTIGTGYTNTDVGIGCKVVYSGGSVYITGVMRGGAGTGGGTYVTLSEAVPDATAITAIYGVETYDTYVRPSGAIATGQTLVPVLDTSSAGHASRNIRQQVDSRAITNVDGSGFVRIKLKGGASEAFTVTNVGIAPHNAAGEAWDFVGTIYEFLWGGNSGTTAPAGSESGWSDWLAYPYGTANYSGSGQHIISMAVTSDTEADSTYSGDNTNAGGWYYKASSAASWNTADVSSYTTGDASSSIVAISAIELGAPCAVIINPIMSATSVDSTDWTDFVCVDVESNGVGTCYHAVSFDGRSTWSVYLSSAWRDIVRDNSGTYEYKNTAGSWVSATINTNIGALTQAFRETGNQWSTSAVEAMGESDWEASGGWTTSVTAVDWACGMAQTSTGVPTVSNVRLNYKIGSCDLVTTAFEASAEPTSAYCVLKVKPINAITENTDLKAWVSMDDGANYDQITLEDAPFREIGDYDYYRGDAATLTSRSDQTVRFKVSGHNGKRVEVYGIALGVKS